MDVQKKLDEIVAAVEGARSMPMSASCVINRAELLSLLEEVRGELPDSLSQAQALLGDREQMVADAQREAERIIETAHEHRGSLVSDTEVARRSQEEADRILAEANREAEEIRAEADEYVDSKLANFEVVLTKTLGSVDRGREKLLGRAPGADEHGEDPEYAEAPERSADPGELRRRADAYVDAKLGAFETVLAKTLEAVGRGRQKLTGHQPIDELAAHMAAQDGMTAAGHQTDAEYLAGLAAPQDPQRERQAAEVYIPQQGYPQPQEYAPDQQEYAPDQQEYAPDQQEYAPAAQYGYGQDSGYGQDGYTQDAYGNSYPVADPYAPQQGYPQQGYPEQATYDWQQQDYDQHQQSYGQHQPHQQHQQPTGLDETSFFDTGLINLDQLRELEQGR